MGFLELQSPSRPFSTGFKFKFWVWFWNTQFGSSPAVQLSPGSPDHLAIIVTTIFPFMATYVSKQI